MRKISIIGAGQAGLILAHKLLKAGYEVHLYSDRTAEDWLERATPTGTAYLFQEAVSIEEELGLGLWNDQAPCGRGVHLSFSPTLGTELIEVMGHFRGRGYAVDQRLKNHAWLNAFEAAGGALHIEAVDVARLDEIAKGSDLTYIAAGKADIGSLVPRDPERSVYDRPQRKLTMFIASGVKGWSARCPFDPIVKFNFFGDIGEAFWVPYFHKTAGATWCVLFEAKPGGAMDRFDDCTTGEQVVDRGREVIRDIMPWDYDVVRDMELADGDPRGWLKGQFPPTVRRAFGRTPSGALVAPVGDTAMTFDPIGGQGANNATRMANFYADRIIERGAEPFTDAWLTENFDAFWRRWGEKAWLFNNILLEPLKAPAKEVMIAMSRNQALAHHFFGCFGTPVDYFPWIDDMAEARRTIAEVTGESWRRAAVLGRLNVAKGQLKQKLTGAHFSRAA